MFCGFSSERTGARGHGKGRLSQGERLRYQKFMQIISLTTLTPLQYLEQNAAEQVQKPESCANCGGANCLDALGYYWRWISYLLDAFQIRIRRFLCLRCGISISCLPGFAQPYRVVNTETVEKGFDEETTREVQHWGWLILAYWKRFTAHLQRLVRTAGNAFGPCPVKVCPRVFWELLLKDCGTLAVATEELVHTFRTCLFGTYPCHQPKLFAK
jgi:hypothetical protein